MNKEQFLSVRFNNALAFGLGLIVTVYIVAVVSSSAWVAQDGFTGLAILGALY